LQDIQDIAENISFKMCHLAGEVVEEVEEFNNNDRNVFTDSEIEVSADDNQIVELKELNEQIELQIINGIVFLMESYGEKEGFFYARFFAEKSDLLRGAVGLFDFSVKNALSLLWRYMNVLVYFEVGQGFENVYLDCF